MVWRCPLCRKFLDNSYDKCIRCDCPKPGTLEQGEIEFTLVLDYVQSGKAMMQTVVVKGPVSLSTDTDHKRIHIAGSAGGKPFEFGSFEWNNMYPHGSPVQIYPLVEGGFEVSCSFEGFMINGLAPKKQKTVVPSGTVIFLSTGMMIKLQDRIAPALVEGTLSPIGAELPEDVPLSLVYKPGGSQWYYFNGLNSHVINACRALGINAYRPEVADLNYINDFVLKEYGMGIRERRAKIKELKG